MKDLYIQKGLNEKYPIKIEIWNINDKNIPEWISDRAKIESINEDGVPIIGILETNNNGAEIINSNGVGTLVKLKNKDEDYICFSINCEENKNSEIKGVFSLTKHQLELLYEKLPDIKD